MLDGGGQQFFTLCTYPTQKTTTAEIPLASRHKKTVSHGMLPLPTYCTSWRGTPSGGLLTTGG